MATNLPFVKICCIASREEAQLAVAAGADALGLVSHMPSGPGMIADETIADIAAYAARHLPQRIRTYLLTSCQTAAGIAAQHAVCKTTTLQLVDEVAPGELLALRRLLPGVQLVQVIHVQSDESVRAALALAPLVDQLLLDSGNPNLPVKALGGTGRTHDWATSRRIRDAVWPLPLYLAGGLNAGNYGEAYSRQYDTGSPSFGAGFVFSIPLENNIGRARLERRRLELRQQLDQLKTTIDSVLLEVKISAREVGTAYRETQAKYSAVRAFTEDIEAITARRSIQAVGDETLMASYLDTLLDSQDRRAGAEEEFIRSAANYQIAIVNLERAKGSLLAYSDVSIVRDTDEKRLPVIRLEKGARDGKSTREGK